MTATNRYRQLAKEFHDRALREESVHLTAEWENLSQSYIQLAEQSDRNETLHKWANTAKVSASAS